MIDLHSHYLPMIDDGSKSKEESLAMLQHAIHQGVTTIFATPHYRNHGTFEKDRAVHQKVFDEMNQLIKENNLPISTVLGAEITYDKYVLNQLDQGLISCLGNSRYILLELPMIEPKEDLSEILYNFRISKYKVIIAHVERYPYLHKLDHYEMLRNEGALLQVNASAILGHEGKKEYKKAWLLLNNGWVDFIASDMHAHRPSEMKECSERILAKYGENIQRSLFIHNPQKVLIEARGLIE